MSIEDNKSVSSQEGLPVEHKPHALFIAGGMGTYKGISDIKAGLKEAYGLENVTVFNSILSSDPQNPKRFKQMADVVMNNIDKGVHIIVHSLGASEARKMIKQIKRKDPEFFNNPYNIENLHITLVSPASIKGVAGPFRFLAKTWRFAREQAETPISKKRTLLRGIDSLTAFPPQNIPDAELTQAMRDAFGKLSQYEEGVIEGEDVVLFNPEFTYFNKLDDKKKEDLETHDKKLKLAIDSKNYVNLRKLVAERGELLRQPLADVFAGKFKDTSGESADDPILEATRATMGGYIDLFNTLVSAISNLPLKEMEELQRRGVRVNFVVPEYDIWKSTEEARRFFNSLEKAKGNVVVAERGAHAYLALQPKLFSKTVFDLHHK